MVTSHDVTPRLPRMQFRWGSIAPISSVVGTHTPAPPPHRPTRTAWSHSRAVGALALRRRLCRHRDARCRPGGNGPAAGCPAPPSSAGSSGFAAGRGLTPALLTSSSTLPPSPPLPIAPGSANRGRHHSRRPASRMAPPPRCNLLALIAGGETGRQCLPSDRPECGSPPVRVCLLRRRGSGRFPVLFSRDVPHRVTGNVCPRPRPRISWVLGLRPPPLRPGSSAGHRNQSATRKHPVQRVSTGIRLRTRLLSRVLPAVSPPSSPRQRRVTDILCRIYASPAPGAGHRPAVSGCGNMASPSASPCQRPARIPVQCAV